MSEDYRASKFDIENFILSRIHNLDEKRRKKLRPLTSRELSKVMKNEQTFPVAILHVEDTQRRLKTKHYDKFTWETLILDKKAAIAYDFYGKGIVVPKEKPWDRYEVYIINKAFSDYSKKLLDGLLRGGRKGEKAKKMDDYERYGELSEKQKRWREEDIYYGPGNRYLPNEIFGEQSERQQEAEARRIYGKTNKFADSYIKKYHTEDYYAGKMN